MSEEKSETPKKAKRTLTDNDIVTQRTNDPGPNKPPVVGGRGDPTRDGGGMGGGAGTDVDAS